MIRRGRSAKDSDSSIFDPNQDNLPAINDFCITDSWTTTYDKMIDSGWTWEKGTGLYDYVYFKPGIKITEGHELNKDFFADEETLREYVKEFYGWTGDNRENKSTTKTIKQELINAKTPKERTTKTDSNKAPSSKEKSAETNNKQSATSKSLQKNVIKYASSKPSSEKPPKSKTSVEGQSKSSKVEKIKKHRQVLQTEFNNSKDESKRKRRKSKEQKAAEKKVIEKNKVNQIKISKGTKTKPGSIVIPDSDDENEKEIRTGQNLAFYVDSKEGEGLNEYFKFQIPSEVIAEVDGKEVITKCFVEKRIKENHFKVAWYYSCASLFPFYLTRSIIDKAILLHDKLFKRQQNSINMKKLSSKEKTKRIYDDFMQRFDELEICDDILGSDEDFESSDEECMFEHNEGITHLSDLHSEFRSEKKSRIFLFY